MIVKMQKCKTALYMAHKLKVKKIQKLKDFCSFASEIFLSLLRDLSIVRKAHI